MAVLLLDVITADPYLSGLQARNLNCFAVVTNSILRVSVAICPVNKLIVTINHTNFRIKTNCIFISSSQEENQFCLSDHCIVGDGLVKSNDGFILSLVAETFQINRFFQVDPFGILLAAGITGSLCLHILLDDIISKTPTYMYDLYPLCCRYKGQALNEF